MKIDGETFKLKTPVKAEDVLKDFPGLVLLESEAVKHYGIRAKPLESHTFLQPNRLYFLVELPKDTIVTPRRVRSGINMSAKDRLESLMLSRRSVSDLSILKQSNMMMMKRSVQEEEEGSSQREINSNGNSNSNNNNNGVRLKMRLPKAEVERVMKEAKDEAEAAQRIMGMCMASSSRPIINGANNIVTTNPKIREVCVHMS